MFNLNTALDLVDKDVWMASVDLTDGYHSVPINDDHKKYLSFVWQNKCSNIKLCLMASLRDQGYLLNF